MPGYLEAAQEAAGQAAHERFLCVGRLEPLRIIEQTGQLETQFAGSLALIINGNLSGNV